MMTEMAVRRTHRNQTAVQETKVAFGGALNEEQALACRFDVHTTRSLPGNG